ncbi:dynein heavy chain 14, axonemal isoform X18 [Mauremys reevesii]|uniref:dynein heavy chain 14, axonemal isoform X18 n=1 Tax=Mauremys reevesii TaxID=260615 RepID=UPI0019401D9F|nr:dynein heavy chain 14, axonemal isoform X18 [Mauremys reevesii]
MDQRYLTQMDEQSTLPKTKLVSRLQLGPENTEIPHMVEGRYIMHEQAVNIEENSSSLPSSVEKYPTALRTAVYRTGTERKHKTTVKEGKMGFEYVLSRKLRESPERAQCETMISLELKSDIGKKHSMIPVHEEVQHVVGTSASSSIDSEGKYNKHKLKMAEKEDDNKETELQTVVSEPSCHTKICKQQKAGTSHNKPIREKVYSYDRTEPTDDDVIKHILRLRGKLGWQTILPPRGYIAEETKATIIQKIALRRPLLLKDSGEYIYCLRRSRNNPKAPYNPYDLQVVSANSARHNKEYWTITASFVSKFSVVHKAEEMEIIPVMEWLCERQLYYMICNFNVFSNVRMKKYFFTWKINVRRAKTTKSKTMMYNQLFLADELFLSCLLYIQGLCEDACNINCCKGSEDNAIYLIKVDRFRTYSLDEFCEEQYQQNKEALHQLQTFREKVIKAIQSTFLRVAEMKGAQKLFQSVPSDSKENPKYAEISEWRQMMKRFSRFLLLVDKIFQELLRKLVHNAVQLLLELFKGSSNVINPDEKKNENLMSIYKNTLVRLSGLLDAEYCSVGVSKEFIRDFERAPQEPSFHSREDKVLKPEIITVADIDKVLEDVKKQLEGEQEYAPVFEVNIGLRIPFEKINDRGSHQEDDPESCEMQDDDSFSLTSVEFLKQRLKDDDNLKSWTQSKSKRAYEELSENTKKQTFKLSQGKTDLSACKGEVKPESDNKAELKHECSSSFCTDIFLIPNRRQFSKKLQGIVDGLENTTAQVIPFSRDTHLSIFITQSLHKIMQSPESCTELWEKEYPAPWPNWELLLGTDPCYQNKILTLLSILSSSMEQVESYSRNFMRYCAMVNEAKTMNMEILALQRELSSHDFRGILNKYTDDVNKIICMTIERRIHMIKVRSVNYQTDCLPYFEALLNIIRSSLYAIVEAKNLHLSEVIHSALRKLDKDLTTVEEFIEHLTFLSQISSELPMLETQYNTLSQLYSIARAYDFFIPAEQFALYQILTRSLHDLKSSILICEKVKNDNIIKFSADLDGYFGNLQFELRNFKNKVRNPVLLLSKTSPKTAKEMIQSLVEEAAVISNKSRSYANYQDLFDSSIADMRSLSLERVSQKSQVGDSSSQRVNKELSKIESELSLRKLLWDLLEEWGKLSFRWKHTLFENIDVDLIQKDVNRFMQTIQILEKGLPENNIIIGLKQSLTDFKEGLSVIVFLRSPYLQPRHWEAIQYIIGQSISWDKKFTLENVLQLNLFQYEKEITDVSVTATNEATLEIMLNKIINLWNKTNFHLSPHRSETSTFMIISSAEDIMAQLEESQVTISTIKGSCYVGPIKNLVDAWDHKLNLFSRTLEEWLTCQRNWIYLEPIFHAPEIQRQLPAEASIFSQVNNKWKEIMACTEDNPNALRAATTAGVLEMLQTNNAHLEKIQKSLEDYLEIKRMIFPRFYFLSNAELLDILAESKNPEAVQPHLVKCFANIRKLYIRRHDQKSPVVVMIGSAEEETLLVPKIIRIRGPVEQWLGNIESSMFDMVKKFVNIGMVEWNQMEFKQWFLTHPGQVVLLVSQIMFNKDCTRSFQSSDPKMALTGIHDELVRHLEQLAEMASDILQFHKQTTLEALLTLYIHCRDILSSLIDKQIFKREDFEWTRQLRYEWNEMNTTCRVVQGTSKVEAKALTAKASVEKKREDQKWFLEKYPDKLPSLLEKLYVFAFTWAVGGVLRRETDYEEESLIGINTKDESLVTVTRGFSNFVRDIFEGESPIGIQFPAGDRVIFEYFVDLQTGDFAPWTDLVPTTQFLIQQETTSFSDSLRSGSNKDVNLGRRDTLKLIPNMETICYSFLTSLLLMNKHPVLITGDSGIGKTAMIQNMLERLQNQGGLFVKSGTILGDVVLHNEIKKASMLKNSSYLTFDMPKGAQKRVWPSPGDSDLKSTTGPYSASETGDIALTSERIKGVIVSTIQCGAHTSAAQIQSWIHQKLILKSKDVLGAPKSKQVIMFIDDLNMPIPEEYGAQPPLETIRQFLDLGGFYDTKQLAWRNIQDVSLVADCAPPSGGRNEISPRLLTHFCLLVLPQPSLQSLQRIFQVNLGTYLYNNRFLSEVQKCSDFLTSSSIAVYYSVCRSMLPTPAKCHYTFNLRDLFKVLQGLLQAHRSVIVSNETAALLFVHETTRVFHDRLIESAEREIFYQFLANELHNYFKITWTKEKLMEESTIFVDFLDMNTPLENKIYRNITNYKKLVSVLEEFQTKMNSTNTKTSMVFFKEAVEHTTRAARVFRQPGGHMMLIGLDGNGKITCATLACYLANCSLFRLSVTHSYSYTDFIEDLKRVYRQTGLEGQNTVLLITDSDIVQDSFLEHLSCILNSGEVLDLFDKEELEGIVVKLTAVAEKADYSNSREAILSFFMQRVRSKLHIVLATSPAGLNFRQLCRIYPSIVNCSTIDWYDNWPEEALLHVAKIYFSHEDICDDSENLTNTVAQVCVEIHKSASTTTEKYLKETKRHYYITPNSYLQFIDTFSSILQSTKKKSLFNRACFYNGLTKLLEATSLVAEMQEELLTLGPQIEQKSKEIEELVEKLHRDSQVVEQVRTLVKQDEEIMAEETKVVEEYARQATEELNAVLPALEKALAALDALDKAHIAELRVYTHPPPLVLTVMNAVCILLQKKPSWATAKLLLADAGFLKKLVTLDKDNLPEKVFLQLKRYVRSPDFSPSKVGLVSIACCSMCHWILALDHYHEVQKLVKPKEIRVTEAQEVLRLAHQKLDEKQRSLALIEEHEQNLEASYQESIAQKEMLATRKQLATQRLHRASILSTALADEMERWKESVNNLDERLQGIMGDALVSAACIIYSGVLSAEYRQQLINECLRLCNENIIPVSPNYSLITAMTEKNEISKWQNEGLPLDQYSIENAILVKYGQRWPLLIDPQKQAYRWICQMEGNRLRQIHASDSNYLRTLENAMRIGDSILLQDLAETLDSNLKPILRKEIYSTGGKDFIRIGDAEIEYNHNFRLYITTQKANPHFLPSVCNVVTMINFTVTFQGLQDQLLSTVVIHETPQLEQQRCELLESISADQITLRELEQKSLKLLQKTEGHILDDQDLIDNLQRTKVTSKEIFERVEASAKTEAAIEKTRKNYLPIATRGAVLYFVVADLIKINYMYQFSLEWFHKIFVESMDLVNKLQSQISLSESTSSVCGTVRALSRQRKRHFTQEHWEECENETDSFNRHLKDIIDMLTNNVYKTVCSALFTENQLCFSFLLCTKIMQNNCGENQPQDNLGFLSENEWNFFLYSSMLANIMDTQSEFENYGSYMFNKTPHLWITESMWKECQYMSTHMQPFNLLCDSLASNSQQWSSFLNSGNLYYLLSTQYRPTSSQQDTDLQSDALKERIGLDSAVVDFHWENLSSFQRIILIKILRPGSLNSAIREFVIEKLGASYLQTGGINLKEVYEDSSAATPLIFIHSHGIDPAAHLLRLAQEIKGSTRHVQMVSLGRGQGSKAEDLIHKAQLLSGQWVFLQNCHLAASFMPRLCTIVDSFTQPNINMDPQFRLWLSSTPDPSFPIPILQKGFKMAIEPPRGLKGKLLQTFGYSGSGDVTEIIFNKVECGLSWKKLVFSLCFFNAVVHERKKYGSLGWNVPYEFNSSDLEVSIQMLGMLLANQEEIPWQAICYLTGEVVYGGRVTDHWDRRCLLSILNNFYSPVVLQEGFAYSSDGVYRPVSATDSLQDCRAYLESLPDTDSPELFGMHACAGRAFLESQAQTFIDTIVSMQPGISMDTLIISGGKSQDELVLEIASDILRQLPLTIEEQDTELTPGTERSSKMKITLGSLLSGPIWAALAKAAKGHDPFINSALLTVLRQEIDRFNNLLSVITISLHSLQQAMKGEIIFTTGLEDLYNSVLKSKVPEFWQLYSYMSNKSLGSWIDDLILRVNFFATWANQVITCIQLRYNSLMLLQKQAKTSGISFSSPTGDRSNISTNSIQGNPSRFWLSGFFSPQGFLTAVLQNYARQNGISVDSLTFGHRLLPTIHDEDCNLREVKRKQNIIQTAFKESSPPENGVLVFGLYIDGARWSTTTHVLEEPFLHDRFYPLPEIVFLPQQIIQTRHTCPDEEQGELMHYECPLYRTPQRAGILLSTGLSTNFVTTVSLPTKRTSSHWVTRGVAMLCQLDD